ncbi:MAG: hypothetical protein WCP07_02675 [bacterium]
MSEENDLLFQMLERIREKPAMYLPERSVMALYTFILGYGAALHDGGLRSEEEWVMSGFQRHVEKKFKINRSTSWGNILLFVHSSNTFAFDAFWEVWDEYLTKVKHDRRRDLGKVALKR